MTALPLLLLLACSAPNVLLPPDSDPPDDSEPMPDDSEPGDTDTEDLPDVDPRKQNDWLFQLDAVHEVSIALSEEAVAALGAQPFEYVTADVTVDGAAFPGVAVRLKGRIGSFRALDAKAAFKVDFNRNDPKVTLDGLEKLNLNNMVQDSAQVHELLAYGVYALAGVPVPRVGYAWVTVNGQPFGLYTLVEAYDDVFLRGWYDDPSGNLYDGDYVWYGGYHYTKLDFDRSVQDLMELDEGTDVGHADIHAVTAALSGGVSGFWDRIDAVVDMDEAIGMWAADAWVGHYDSYSYNQNNFRVYFDPADGRADLFPWDPDWAFYDHTPITSPYGLISYTCQRDRGCYDRFHTQLLSLCDAVEASDLPERLRTASALIAPYVEQDPRRETTPGSIAAYQEAARAWLVNRRAVLESAFGI